MALEVRELVIRTTISDNAIKLPVQDLDECEQQDQQMVVDECVRQVLQIIKERRER